MSRSWILLVFFLLQFSEVCSVTVREGADVTLSCESVSPDQPRCEQTTWDFTNGSGQTDLYVFGQKKDSSGVSLSESCSLVLETVSEEQVGVYRCRQYDDYYKPKKGDTIIRLSVVSLSELRDKDRVGLSCSVWTYGVCRFTVKWTNKDQEVIKDHKQLQTSHSECYSTVAFLDPDRAQPSQFYQTLKCEVTDDKQKFSFSPRSTEINPGKSPSEETETSTDQTGPTLTETITNHHPGPTHTVLNKETSVFGITPVNSVCVSHSDSSTALTVSLVSISVSLVSVAVIVVVFIVWRRQRGPDLEENMKYSSVKFIPASAESQPEVIP